MASITNVQEVSHRWEELIAMVETMEMGAAKAKRLMKTIELTDDAIEFEAVISAIEKILIGHSDRVEALEAEYVKNVPVYRRKYAARFFINDAVRIDEED